MKSKLKYYAQIIGVNLLAILVPILAVVLIYGFGKLKNIYTHPCVLSQDIYDCCLEATIVVLAGFSVGLLLVGWADSWRKAKLRVLKGKREREELELHIKLEVEPIGERTEQKNTLALGDSEFEDISGLTVKEIWELYKGREIDLLGGNFFIAGYDEEPSFVVVGTKLVQPSISYDEMVERMASKNPDKWHVEKGYADYGTLSTKYIHIYKKK